MRIRSKKLLKQCLGSCRRFGFIGGMRLWLKVVIGNRSRRLIKLHVPGLGSPVWLRAMTSDVDTFFQVFVNAEYDVSGTPQWSWLNRRYDDMILRKERPLIIDCGANIGLASLWFASRFPQADMLAIEPDESNVALMRKNLIAHPGIKIMQGAIWDRSCNLVVTNSGAAPWAYALAERECGKIKAYTIDELSSRRAILIAKIDIEGAEEALFRSNTEWLNQTDLVTIELHDWLLPDRRTSSNFIKRIAQERFDVLSTSQNFFFFLHH